MPFRECVFTNSATISVTGAQTAYTHLMGEACRTARFTLTVAVASGSMTAVIQRARRTVAAGDMFASGAYIWEDFIAFTTTSAAGVQYRMATIYQTTTSQTSGATVVPFRDGNIPPGAWMGPPIGPGPFRAYVVMGTNAVFSGVTITGEFEF